MKITLAQNKYHKSFNTLERGDCFVLEQETNLYVKIKPINTEDETLNAFCLNDCSFAYFSPLDNVISADVEIKAIIPN